MRGKSKRSSDARAHDHHTLQVMRQQAVKAVRTGETADSVSKAMGVNIRTVFRCLAVFSVGGQSALLAKPIHRREKPRCCKRLADGSQST